MMRASTSAWSYYVARGAVVNWWRDDDGTPVVAVAATSIGGRMPPETTAARDWHDQIVRSLITPKRHGLCGGR